MIDVDALLAEIEDGRKPSRTVAAALALELLRRDVASVPEVTPRALFQAGKHGERIATTVANMEAGNHWCWWHRRWEPRSAFGDRQQLRICREGDRENQRLRVRPKSRKVEGT